MNGHFLEEEREGVLGAGISRENVGLMGWSAEFDVGEGLGYQGTWDSSSKCGRKLQKSLHIIHLPVLSITELKNLPKKLRAFAGSVGRQSCESWCLFLILCDISEDENKYLIIPALLGPEYD